MINKENEDSSEDYESVEDNQILITQEISNKESSQDETESDDQNDCDGICACSYKSINLISKNLKTHLNIFICNYVSVDPHFSRASPLDRRDSLFICEKLIFRKVGVATYFIFILKGKIKQERKTLKSDSIIFGKRHVFEKTRV